jgi:hypothetical protein
MSDKKLIFDSEGYLSPDQINKIKDILNISRDIEITEDELLEKYWSLENMKESKIFKKNQLTEKFKSKKQQKYFYSKCDDASTKEEKKWCKMAKEFSSKTDFENLPEEINVNKKELKESDIIKLIHIFENPKISKKGLINYIKESKSNNMIVTEQDNTYFERTNRRELFTYLEKIRESGIVNMYASPSILTYTKDDLYRFLFGMKKDPESIESLIDNGNDDNKIESSEAELSTINYLLDNKQKIRDILIRIALNKMEENGIDDFETSTVNRYFDRAAKDAFKMFMQYR